MDSNIQHKIDSGNGTIILPPGEFQGPFYINHPCTVEGNSTTLWNRGDNVLVIDSPGVTLKNLRIELIESSDDFYSVCSDEKVTLENVEITGRTSGFGMEDLVPRTARQIKLGRFSADMENSFVFELYSPGISRLETDMRDIRVEPSELMPGINRIRLTVNALPSGTFLYGDIVIHSGFSRRFYIQGISDNSAENAKDILISTVNQSEIDALEKSVSERQSSRLELMNTMRAENAVSGNTASERVISTGTDFTSCDDSGVHIVSRGERISIEKYSGDVLTVRMAYEAVNGIFDIDPYAFMLDAGGITSCDDDFVFFGNRETASGAILFNEDKSISVNLKKVPEHIKKISFVYSIYKPGPLDNFSKVKSPYISVFQRNRELFRYTASELFSETTIIFMELYKHSSGWKMNAIGQGYKDGLKRLCSGYGLIVS